MTTDISKIIDEFDTFGITLSDEAANQCLALCKKYDVDGEQLGVLWLTFSSSHGYNDVTLEALDHLDRVEQQSKKKKPNAGTPKRKFNDSVDNGREDYEEGGDDEDILDDYSDTYSKKTPSRSTLTPKANKSNSSGKVRSISAQFNSPTLSHSVSSPSIKYSSRTNSGQVVVQYGNADHETKWAANSDFKPDVKVLAGFEDETPLTNKCKYMYEKLSLVAEVRADLAQSLAEEMKNLMLKKGKDDEEENYVYVDTISCETIPTVGRVSCDCNNRLNAASVVLEGGMEGGRECKAQLDLTNVRDYSIFPGQIVGLKGKNPTGTKLIAQEVVDGKLPPESQTPITISKKTGPVQLVVASGPFTSPTNLLYEPLTDLLTTVRDKPPHILVLLGPFLDASHPLVVGNDLGETHDAVFERCLRIISSTLESTLTQVILVPSSRDVCSVMMYPTPPYTVPGNFISVSDPAYLDIEGVVVALTSTDVLFHLSKEEISVSSQAPDRMGRLSRHLLKQRCMYPLYPPHETMCIVMELLEIHAHIPCKPHLMLLPSDLRYFAKEVEGCVVVNPEHLAKGLVGGTYARIELNPPSSDTARLPSINVSVIKV